MSYRYPATQGRRDANEPVIQTALERAGATVEQLPTGQGMPDLLCGYKGINYLLEVKLNPVKGEVFASHCSLNKKQRDWHSGWKGQKCIVRTPEEALQAIGAI
jgi:hypothetical protein